MASVPTEQAFVVTEYRRTGVVATEDVFAAAESAADCIAEPGFYDVAVVDAWNYGVRYPRTTLTLRAGDISKAPSDSFRDDLVEHCNAKYLSVIGPLYMSSVAVIEREAQFTSKLNEEYAESIASCLARNYGEIGETSPGQLVEMANKFASEGDVDCLDETGYLHASASPPD